MWNEIMNSCCFQLWDTQATIYQICYARTINIRYVQCLQVKLNSLEMMSTQDLISIICLLQGIMKRDWTPVYVFFFEILQA